MVVQSSENWQRCDIADSTRSPEVLRPFVQGEMRSDFVVVGRIRLEDPAQVGLTEQWSDFVAYRDELALAKRLRQELFNA
jgi:hypothetical protein